MDHITGIQLSEWEAYNVVDPIGKWRDEFGLAKIESLIINIVNALYHKEGVTPEVAIPTDFMMKWGEEEDEPEPKKQSTEEMKQMLIGITKAFKKNSGKLNSATKVKSDKYQGR